VGLVQALLCETAACAHRENRTLMLQTSNRLLCTSKHEDTAAVQPQTEYRDAMWVLRQPTATRKRRKHRTCGRQGRSTIGCEFDKPRARFSAARQQTISHDMLPASAASPIAPFRTGALGVVVPCGKVITQP